MELIRTIAADNEVEVTRAENKDHLREETVMLGEKTRQILDSLIEMLLSEDAVAISYINIKQLLIAAYKAFERHRYHYNATHQPVVHFRNRHQEITYTICVAGLITSLLVPEEGKKWCKGIYFTINNIPSPRATPNADICELADGRSIYRPSRDSREGSGFQFMVDIFGCTGAPGNALRCHASLGKFLENYFKQTQQSFEELAWRVYRREDHVAPSRQWLIL